MPIVPATGHQLVVRGGTDRLITALAAVIRDAMAADATGGGMPRTSIEDDWD